MCVYAANATKVMLCDLGVPLIQNQFIRATGYAQAVKRNACHDRAFSAANRAVAAADIFMAVDQINFEFHSLAMASAFYSLHETLFGP